MSEVPWIIAGIGLTALSAAIAFAMSRIKTAVESDPGDEG